MAKIFWTHEERELILEQAVDLQRIGYKLFDAIKRAQVLVLPAGRHRPLNTPSSVVDMTRELRIRVAAAKAKVTATAAPIVTPMPQQMVASEPQPVQAIDVIDEYVEKIATALAKRIASELHTQIRAVKELEHTFSVEKHNPEYESVKLFKPKIAIIGLLDDQVEHIKREFSNEFNIKFIDTDRAMGLKPTDADAYLLMKNFINHPLYRKYQGFANHVLIDGGMSSLRMWLYTKGKEL